jgi:outer membrane protein TolC
MSSSYSVGVSLGLSAEKFAAPKQAKAQQKVVDENIDATRSNMIADVTAQYLAALRATASVAVTQQQVIRSRQFFDLANARLQVGSGNGLDAKQAEVDVNRAELQLLRVRQAESQARIELLRRIGIPLGPGADSVQLVEAFPLTQVTVDVAQLLQAATQDNTSLRVAAAQEEVSRLSLSTARKAYFPTFSISTGISGSSQAVTNTDGLVAARFASARNSASNCELQNALYSRLTSPLPLPNGGIVADCFSQAGLTSDGGSLTPAAAAAVREGNEGFPFNYRRGPLGVSFGISLPIWDGFQRANRIASARVAVEDSRDLLRARTLDVSAQIISRSGDLRTAWEAIRLQDLVRTNAQQQLQLAQARFQGGSATALDVQTAQNSLAQAEADYVTAVYDYHTAVVSLETLVGRPLR